MKKLFALLLAAAMLCLCACAEGVDVSALRISSPTGAPGLALATLAAEHPDNYTYLTVEALPAEFANGTADFIIAPINAGAKLYKAGKSNYRLAAVVAWGNLFIASQREGFALEDINGAEITLFGENTINASIALYALSHNGIEPGAVSYLAGAANTQQLLLSDESAIVLTAEPALTAARMKNDRITGYAVNDLYMKATGIEGFAQAGLFVRGGLIEENPAAVDAYLALAADACDRCASDPEAVAAAAVALEILPSEKVALSAIPNCAIRFVPAPEAKPAIETTAQIDLAQYGGAVPLDDFYYGAR